MASTDGTKHDSRSTGGLLLRRLPYEAALQLPILEGEKTIQPIWLLGEEKQFYLTSLVKELLNKMVYLK